MNQMMIGLVLILGLGGFYLYNENQTLTQNNIKLEAAVEEQKQAIESIRESYEKQGEALNNMSRANAAIQAEKDSYLEIFKRHNLNLLAIKKPGMIETRINNGTKKVFEGLENDSKNITVTATADDDS